MKQILIFLLLSTSVGFAQFDNLIGDLTKSVEKITSEGITIVSNSSAAEGSFNLHTYVFFDSENKKVYTLAISESGGVKEQIWTFKDLNELEEESKNKKKK